MIAITNVFPKLKNAKDVVRKISKEPSFRTLIDSKHAKGSRRCVKSAWEHFYHVVSSLWGKLIWKTSLLVICKIFGVFVNTFTTNDKYPLRNCENLPLSIQMHLSKNKNLFSKFLFHFWNFHQILNILKKKMIVITNIFPQLKTVKDVLRQISEKPCFRKPFDSQHVKGSQRLVKSAWEHFYHIFSLLWHFERNWFGKLFSVLCSIFEYKSNFKQFSKKWAS